MKIKDQIIKLSADSVSEDGTFIGYASTFGTINSYGEYVEKGAYTETIANLGDNKLPMLWTHNDEEPIGYFTELVQDEVGLKVKGTLLVNDIAKAKEVHSLIKNGVVTGMSIGGYVKDYDNKNDALLAIDLREISVCTFPADGNARISEYNDTDLNIREVEHALRDVGVSQRISKKFAKEICDFNKASNIHCDDELASNLILNSINSIKEI